MLGPDIFDLSGHEPNISFEFTAARNLDSCGTSCGSINDSTVPKTSATLPRITAIKDTAAPIGSPSISAQRRFTCNNRHECSIDLQQNLEGCREAKHS